MNIFQRIGLAFSAIVSGLVAWYSKEMTKGKAFLKKEIPFAIAVGDQLKKFLDSPELALINTIIPGGWDDALVAGAKKILPVAMVELKMIEGNVDLTNNDAIIQAGVTYLKTTNPTDYELKITNLISLLSSELTDGKMSVSEAVILVKSLYDSLIKK